MNVMSIDNVWRRVSEGPLFRGRKLSDFVAQVITQNFTLATGAQSAQTPVQFGPGAVIYSIQAAAQPSAQAATQTYRPGLDLFSIAMSYQTTNRTIIGSSEAIGSSVFGTNNDQFPGMEIILPPNGTLLYSVTNLTTTTITVTIAHHCLMPAMVG